MSLLSVTILFWTIESVLAEENPTIDGWQDYEQGDVYEWASNVEGWAINPENPDEDVNWRILIAGFEVNEVKAESYREVLVLAWNEGIGVFPMEHGLSR